MNASAGLRARISRRAAQSDPQAARNAFIEMLITSRRDQLSASQQVAYLAFWHDSTMRNGGHARVLVNQEPEAVEHVAVALDQIGAGCQAELLREALSRCQERARLPGAASSAYAPAGGQGEFLDLDSFYHVCNPTVAARLDDYLHENFGEFIEIEEDI